MLQAPLPLKGQAEYYYGQQLAANGNSGNIVPKIGQLTMQANIDVKKSITGTTTASLRQLLFGACRAAYETKIPTASPCVNRICVPAMNQTFTS